MEETLKVEQQSETQFETEVFPAELEQLALRRKRHGIPARGLKKALDGFHGLQSPEQSRKNSGRPGIGRRLVENVRDFLGADRRLRPALPPSVKLGLKGLAFSGGGLRSATFNLGVIQALAELKLLKYFDYLSTVSGGGYIGSCLSSLINGSPDAGKAFPLRVNRGSEESPALNTLRNTSAHYLAPGSAAGAARMASNVARGFFLNVLLFVPYLIWAAVLNHLFLGGRIKELFDAPGTADLGDFFVYSPLAMLGLFGVVILWKPLGHYLQALMERASSGTRNAREAQSLIDKLAFFLICACGSVLLIEALGALVLNYAYLRRHLAEVAGAWLNSEHGGMLDWAWFVFAWAMTMAPIWFKPLVGFAPLALAARLYKQKGMLGGTGAVLALGLIPVCVALIFYLDLSLWFSLGKEFEPLLPAVDWSQGAPHKISEWLRGVVYLCEPPTLVALWLAFFSLNAALALGGLRFSMLLLRRILRGGIALLGLCMIPLLAAWIFGYWKAGYFPEFSFLELTRGYGLDAAALAALCAVLAVAMRYWEPPQSAEGYASRGLRAVVLSCLIASVLALLAKFMFWSVDSILSTRTSAWVRELWPWTLALGSLGLVGGLGIRLTPLYHSVSNRVQQMVSRLPPVSLALALLPLLAALFLRGESFRSLVPWGHFEPYIFYSFSAASVLWYCVFLFVDVNSTSLHRVYRDQLAKAYLFVVGKDGRPQPNTLQKLSGLDGAKGGPYHLINAALNLPASNSTSLNGRSTGFFTFSRDYIGGPQTGWQKTEQMEREDSALDLGTALAISGAAAAPNMGTQTIRPLVPFLTMLNIRLSYWLPNPRPSSFRRMMRKIAPRVGNVGYSYLLKEMFSFLDESRLYVNVSDGGHIENLGVYELLRRRCALIVACDAEADPQISFGSLAALLRYASIDLGVKISIDLDALRPGADGFSKAHGVLGDIDYGNGGRGTLLYLKSSLGEGHDEVVRGYKSGHPDFPHESTADQFFNEAQFEAYRSLGYQIASGLLKDPRLARQIGRAA